MTKLSKNAPPQKAKMVAAGSATKGGAAQTKDHGVAKTTTQQRAEDISNIFSTLKKQKPIENASSTSDKKRPITAAHTLATAVVAAEAPPLGDGLYREKAPDIDMNDAEFFGDAFTAVADSTGKRMKKKKKGASGESEAAVRKHNAKEMEGLHRMMTEEEVLKITSSNPKAGSTPNCPFDCDCCF